MFKKLVSLWLSIALVSFGACYDGSVSKKVNASPSTDSENSDPGAGGTYNVQEYSYYNDVPYQKTVDGSKTTVLNGKTLYEQQMVEKGYVWENTAAIAFSSMVRSILFPGMVVDYNKLRLNIISKIIMDEGYRTDLVSSTGSNGQAVYEMNVEPGLVVSQQFYQKVVANTGSGEYPFLASSYWEEMFSESQTLASNGINASGSLSNEALALKCSYSKSENFAEASNQHVMLYQATIVDFVVNADIDQRSFWKNYSSDKTPAVLSSIAYGKTIYISASWTGEKNSSAVASAIGFGIQYAGVAGVDTAVNDASTADSTLSGVTIKVMIIGGSPREGAMVLINPNVESISAFIQECVGHPEYATPIAFGWTAPDGRQLSFTTAAQYAQVTSIGELITSKMTINSYYKSAITGTYTIELLSIKKAPVYIQLSAGGDCSWETSNHAIAADDAAWTFNEELQLWKLAKTATITSWCRDMNDDSFHEGSFSINASAVVDGIAYPSSQYHGWRQWTRKYVMRLSW